MLFREQLLDRACACAPLVRPIMSFVGGGYYRRMLVACTQRQNGRSQHAAALPCTLLCVPFWTELKAERAKASETDFVQQAKRMELQQQLEDERILHAELVLRQKEECEQAKRALQVSPGHALGQSSVASSLLAWRRAAEGGWE